VNGFLSTSVLCTAPEQYRREYAAEWTDEKSVSHHAGICRRAEQIVQLADHG
jgi:hypothetical protein